MFRGFHPNFQSFTPQQALEVSFRPHDDLFVGVDFSDRDPHVPQRRGFFYRPLSKESDIATSNQRNVSRKKSC